MTLKRLIMLGLVLAAVFFAVQGGEYSTLQWLSLRTKERVTRAEVTALAREVDSLARVKKLLETDKDTQERVAREQYGMLRAGETEFTLVRPGR